MTVVIVTKNGNFRVSENTWHNMADELYEERGKKTRFLFCYADKNVNLEEGMPCFLYLKDIKYVYYTNKKNDDADVISEKPDEDKQTITIERTCPYPYCPWDPNPYEPTITCNSKAKNTSSICKTKL